MIAPAHSPWEANRRRRLENEIREGLRAAAGLLIEDELADRLIEEVPDPRAQAARLCRFVEVIRRSSQVDEIPGMRENVKVAIADSLQLLYQAGEIQVAFPSLTVVEGQLLARLSEEERRAYVRDLPAIVEDLEAAVSGGSDAPGQ